MVLILPVLLAPFGQQGFFRHARKLHQGLELFWHHRATQIALLDNAVNFLDQRDLLAHQGNQSLGFSILKGGCHCLRNTLDVDTPAGQLGRKASILTLTPDCQRKLVIRHDHGGRSQPAAPGVRELVQVHPGNTGRAQRLGDKHRCVGTPLNHVDLLFVQLAHDVLDADTAHPHARADRIDTLLQRSNRHLRAMPGFTSNILDLNLTVVDLRHFIFKQATEHVAVAAAHNNLWTTITLFHFQEECTHLVVRTVAFTRHHVSTRQQRFSTAQANRHTLGRHALNRPGDQVAFTLDILLIEVLAFSFPDLLQDHLLGSLRGDTPKLTGRILNWDHQHITQLDRRIDLLG